MRTVVEKKVLGIPVLGAEKLLFYSGRTFSLVHKKINVHDDGEQTHILNGRHEKTVLKDGDPDRIYRFGPLSLRVRRVRL